MLLEEQIAVISGAGGAVGGAAARTFVTYMTDGTALGRMPRLQQVADAAAFAASDRAGAMTGAVVNLTCGSIMSAS